MAQAFDRFFGGRGAASKVTLLWGLSGHSWLACGLAYLGRKRPVMRN